MLRELKKFKYVLLAISIICAFSTEGCSIRSKISNQINTKNSVSNDTCYVGLESNDTIFNCKTICVIIDNQIVKTYNNSDYGIELSPLLAMESKCYFLVYDLPTGRQKILAIIRDKKLEVVESNWFDNEAIGYEVKESSLFNFDKKVGVVVYDPYSKPRKEFYIKWK